MVMLFLFGFVIQLSGHRHTIGGSFRLMWGDRIVALYFLIATVSQYYLYYTDETVVAYPTLAIFTGILFVWNAITEYKNRMIFKMFYEKEFGKNENN